MSADDEPVGYMERTRHYYRALGYERDYVWARFDQVPFARLAKPLRDCRVALITTAAPPDFNGIRKLWWGSTADPPVGLKTAHLAWDKESTHTDDRESFLPIEAASALAADGVIAGLTARFYGVPTTYSQRQTMAEDAPSVLSLLREDGADAAVLSAL
jgi:D-proline reductase (dithiol) PrdB